MKKFPKIILFLTFMLHITFVSHTTWVLNQLVFNFHIEMCLRRAKYLENIGKKGKNAIFKIWNQPRQPKSIWNFLNFGMVVQLSQVFTTECMQKWILVDFRSQKSKILEKMSKKLKNSIFFNLKYAATA